MEVRSQAVLETVDNNPPEEVRLSDVRRLMNTLKLNKACRFYCISNACFRHLPRRPIVQIAYCLCWMLMNIISNWFF